MEAALSLSGTGEHQPDLRQPPGCVGVDGKLHFRPSPGRKFAQPYLPTGCAAGFRRGAALDRFQKQPHIAFAFLREDGERHFGRGNADVGRNPSLQRVGQFMLRHHDRSTGPAGGGGLRFRINRIHFDFQSGGGVVIEIGLSGGNSGKFNPDRGRTAGELRHHHSIGSLRGQAPFPEFQAIRRFRSGYRPGGD